VNEIMPRYLTKSRFGLALECPAKLFYTGKDEYPDKKSDNELLEALAKGGFQVGALAKCYYPEGHEIGTLDYNQAVEQTNELLKQENVVIFEAAFQIERFFIRADIIEKKGNNVNLIEVKSKSFSGNSSLNMLNKSGYLASKWKTYVYDVAFQKHVITKARKDWQVNAYLMLANKNAVATVDGLNQKFLLREQVDDISYVQVIGGTSYEDLGEEILIRVNVDDLCDMIYEGKDAKTSPEMGFEDYINHLADHYWNDDKIIFPLHAGCGKCEFQATAEEEQEGKISGFKECWREQLGWQNYEFERPLIFDIWNFRGKQKLIDDGIYHLDQLTVNRIGEVAENTASKLTTQSRQWLQVQRTVNNNTDPYINIDGLKKERDKWVYPLHMIDFETSAVAIPFYKGRRPYEATAFQFSHHIIYEDGLIEHKGQYLNVEHGVFPNFEFSRRLKEELTQDRGSVFRYASHENTILNHIRGQLLESSTNEVPDKYDLIEFILTITHSDNHRGDRDMIDLLELVKSYYWHPIMGGSNRLKTVLPAVLNSSDYIKEKYSQPIYGKNSEIRSLNFEDGWRWIEYDNDGNIISPYKLLPPLFENLDEEQIDNLFMDEKLADGGAAMTAYAMMQFTQMSEEERERIIDALLKYCELDTMAMVFLWEYWNKIID
jgi:hypothetical protein